jgi:hypothetical protein
MAIVISVYSDCLCAENKRILLLSLTPTYIRNTVNCGLANSRATPTEAECIFLRAKLRIER